MTMRPIAPPSIPPGLTPAQRAIYAAAWRLRPPPSPISTPELVAVTPYGRSTVNRAIREMVALGVWKWRRFDGRPGCEAGVDWAEDVDPVRDYMPDADEIAAGLAKIQASWSAAQRAHREACPPRAWQVPGEVRGDRRRRVDVVDHAS